MQFKFTHRLNYLNDHSNFLNKYEASGKQTMCQRILCSWCPRIPTGMWVPQKQFPACGKIWSNSEVVPLDIFTCSIH